jgi:PAS domain S-box-containing protein
VIGMQELPERRPVILIVEDDQGLADLEKRRLIRAGLDAKALGSLEAARRRVLEEPPDLLLVDYQLLDGHAGDLLDWLKDEGIRIPVVVVTGRGDEHVAVEMMKWGASDYLVKGAQTLDLLPEVVNRVLKQEETRRQLEAMQQLLAASEAQYRELVESVPEMIWMTDLAGTILFVNKAAEQITGYQTAELIGKSAGGLFWSAEESEAVVSQGAALAPGQPFVTEVTLRHRDGHPMVLVVTGYCKRNEKGEPAALTGFARDVTDQRRLEGQLRQSQKLEAIGRLAGGIAHDFNNLLTGILGSAQILREEMPADSPYLEDLDAIISGANRAAGLTRQLLAFGRMQPLAMAPLRVGDVVREMVRLLQRTLGQDIAIRVSLTPDEPYVLADASQLEQVLLNLSLNARDAMPDGGTLTISTDLTAPPGSLPGEPHTSSNRALRLSVADSGVGMDELVRNRLFEPYFTTKSMGKGTGLGLSVVHGIVVQHQGWIRVESEPGAGSRFDIYLPVTEHNVEPTGVDGVPSPARGSEHVLVAEDEIPVRRLVERVLTARGYRVTAAADGAEAVRLYRENPSAFHLVLLDVVMPELNGRQAMEQIRSIDPRIPIVFMSGYAQDILGTSLAPFESVAFLQKPFTPDDLVRLVRLTLDNQLGGTVTGGASGEA